MAGTIVADTIQDGAGNSTSMDNAIYGSAKAWCKFSMAGGTVSGLTSYNVSSITRNGTGLCTLNFTTAFADINYSIVASAGGSGVANCPNIGLDSSNNRTTTSIICASTGNNSTTNYDFPYYCFAVFR
jgi:hypothetical protein